MDRIWNRLSRQRLLLHDVVLREPAVLYVVQPRPTLVQGSLEDRVPAALRVRGELPDLLHQWNRLFHLVEQQQQVLERCTGLPVRLECTVSEP